MPRARKGSATPSGLVLFDKPAGPSSFAIVRDLRERTGARAGHAGTLDPLATGLLLVLLGAFTKQAQRFVGLTKRYETAIDLAAVTSTGDPEGEVVEEHEPLSEDLGGHCVSLRRTHVGPFDVADADPQRIIPPDDAVAALP